MDIQGFLYRRFSKFVTCTFNYGDKKIKLYDKQHIASFQDVFISPFYLDCFSHLTSMPSVVMDLGANLGFFSILYSNFFEYKGSPNKSELILVEANPYILPALKRNLENYKITNYQLLNGVIGPKEKMVSFFVNTKLSMASSVLTKEKHSKLISVPSIDLNSLLSLHKIDLVKIDIEGSEYELFENFFDAITRIRTIIVEFHSEDKTGHVIDRLHASGYKTIISTKENISGLQLEMFTKG